METLVKDFEELKLRVTTLVARLEVLEGVEETRKKEIATLTARVDVLEKASGETKTLEGMLEAATRERDNLQDLLAATKPVTKPLAHTPKPERKPLLQEVRKQKPVPAEKTEACRNFVASGYCKYGDNCNFLHAAKAPCQLYRLGKYHNHKECPFVHEPAPVS